MIHTRIPCKYFPEKHICVGKKYQIRKVGMVRQECQPEFQLKHSNPDPNWLRDQSALTGMDLPCRILQPCGTLNWVKFSKKMTMKAVISLAASSDVAYEGSYYQEV